MLNRAQKAPLKNLQEIAQSRSDAAAYKARRKTQQNVV
jgi:hypothetical protein